MKRNHELANICLQVAQEAAEVALAGWGSKPELTFKGRRDLVTEYDRRCERLIRERLITLAPGIAVVGEEEGGDATEGLRFYVDPIDGTTNFAHGHHIWGVSVGVLEDQAPIAGAVVAPALRTTWWGAVGVGATRNGVPCQVSTNSDPYDALVATGFPQDRTTAPANNFDSFAAVKKVVRAVRRCGACCIDLSYVADGTYDAYWERKLHPWDAAAGAAILLASGGTLTGIDLGPINWAEGYLLASNGAVHETLSSLIGR